MAIVDVKSNKTYTDLYGDHANNLVVIGNDKVANKFQSHVKMEFWGENYIALNEAGVEGNPSLKDEIITLDLPKKKVEWFKGDDGHGNAINGVLHWVETLKEKPDSNVWSLEINDGGQFNYFYQTPLTKEALKYPGSHIEYYTEDGIDYVKLVYPPGGGIVCDYRPLDVEGSIAVYHKTKAHFNEEGVKNYRTGKALHIKRPKAVDANNNWVFCEINVKDGIYTRTIPQDFLDNAVYPVRINDQFGYWSVGGTNSAQSATYINGHYIGSIGVAGTCTQMSLYVSVGPSDTPIVAALYDNDPNGFSNSLDDDKDPDSRLALSDESIINGNNAWRNFAVSVGGSFSAGGLWLAQNHGDDQLTFKFDTDSTYDQSVNWYQPGYTGVPATDCPSTWGTSADSRNDRKYSAYMTYTPSAAGTAGAMSLNTGYWGPEI